MMKEILSKVDFRISPKAFSRANYQVELILDGLKKVHKRNFNNLLDVGGGFDGRYRKILSSITRKYLNLEVKKGRNVDIVATAYRIPKPAASFDLVTLFMVLEHLSEPLLALKECNRVLEKGGFLVLTTVQYWHTHSYPSDYYRYTKYGLLYLLRKTGFKVTKIWSHGGPFLVLFHVVELNLPDAVRTLYSILLYRLSDWLDWKLFAHSDNRKPNNDSVGWSVIAQKI
jgi:SAM-dependent methyltransferase